MSDDSANVVVVGGGLAGLSAALFTARADLSTRVVSEGEPILERNAHLENYPGFPAGVNPRLLLDDTREQVVEAGATLAEGQVVDVAVDDDGFGVATADGDVVAADAVVAASWSDASYLTDLDVGLIDRGSKRYVDVDEYGRTGVDGLYTAGRLAGAYHQAIVAAGHGATVGRTVVEDSDVPFYHDWTAPEGYFTGRGRDVPPGCEEIGEAQRRRREDESLDAVGEGFDAPHPGEPTMHPSVADDE